jgi:hypothetical protein
MAVHEKVALDAMVVALLSMLYFRELSLSYLSWLR